ncbi:MAG: glycosyltransferase family 2 protein [Anaerolineae bacterium]|nr:glycosyltransferase family 2 protein [Anaerolineae bacterium]MCA9910482.1 glycosyltransferase family 2 protein [Anaerolineae bacterium]
MNFITAPTRLERQPRATTRARRSLVSYYLALVVVTVIGITYGLIFSEIFMPGDKAPWIETTMTILKIAWLFPLPYALVNVYGLARYPAIPRRPPLQVNLPTDFRIFFRIVTRGHNPRLIAETVADARATLEQILPPETWRIEVVSDSYLDLDADDDQVALILVPEDYAPENGARFKARALHYTLTASSADPQDWIVHLDEETRFDGATIRSMLAFIHEERARTRVGDALPHIGQGVIVYGRCQVKNWFTTLADSVRAADDLGRFRWQFSQGKAWFGLHGSFIVINNQIEQFIGFDHGPDASITEDSYFALSAQSLGFGFDFIDAVMYEKSPFSVRDFVKQRQRWFAGMWLVALSHNLPVKERWLLLFFMLMWTLSWLCPVMLVVNVIFPTGTPVWLGIPSGISAIYTVWLYVVGFLFTFSRQQLGWRYFPLLIAQVACVPLFGFLESAAVITSVLKPTRGFYIVQKEA